MMFWKKRVTPGKLVTMLSYAQKCGAEIRFGSEPFTHEVLVSYYGDDYFPQRTFRIAFGDNGEFLDSHYENSYDEACEFFPSVYQLTAIEARLKKRRELIDSLNLTPEQKELLEL